MKILYNPTFTNQFIYPQKVFCGGMEYFDDYLIRALCELGHTVHILGSKQTLQDEVQLPLKTTNCNQLYANKEKKGRNWGVLFKDANYLIKDYDIFYTNNMLTSTTIQKYPELASKTINILHCYQPDKKTRLKTMQNMDFVNKQGGKTTTVAWNNQNLYKAEIDNNKLEPFKLTPFLIHWFDKEIRKPVSVDNGHYILIARNSYEKRIQFAINLACELDIHLDIFTTSDEGLYMNSLNNVDIYTNVPHKLIMNLLPDYKALIHPSTIEGSCIVTFEAASCGLPVIYEHKGIKEYLNKPNGLFCSKDSDYRFYIESLENGDLNIDKTYLYNSMLQDRFTWKSFKKRVQSLFTDDFKYS